jgi:hypothetical protein
LLLPYFGWSRLMSLLFRPSAPVVSDKHRTTITNGQDPPSTSNHHGRPREYALVLTDSGNGPPL